MKKITTFIALLLSINIAFAQETVLKNPEKLVSEINKLAKSTSSIQADFIQEKKLDYLKDKQVSSGKFYSQKENMRWEQTKPSSYIMLISDKGMKIKDNGKEREFGAAADKYLDQIRGILLTSITGNFSNNADFKATYLENDKFYIVKLIPVNRRISKMFKGINLTFNKSTFRLKTLSFVQEDGISTMTFSNEIFNSAISNTKFTQF